MRGTLFSSARRAALGAVAPVLALALVVSTAAAAGGATHLGVAAAATTVSGRELTLTVTALDSSNRAAADYRGKVHLTSTDPAAILPADYTFTSDDAGVHTFTVTLKTAGARSVTVKDAAAASIAGTAASTVSPGATAKLVAAAAARATKGQALAVQVSAADAAGNVTPGYVGRAALTSSDSAAVLPAAYTFAAKDKGVHAFAVTLKTTGDQTVTASDGTLDPSSATVSVDAGAVTRFGVSGPATTVSGNELSLTVTALNAYGLTVTGYTGKVHLTSTDAAAVLPADYTFTSDDKGVHSFAVTLMTAGARSITVKDAAAASVAGTATSTVSPGATAGLAVAAAATATKGQALAVTVRAVDAAGNVTPGYTGAVALSSSDTRAALPAPYLFVAKDKGVHAFAVTLKSLGDQTVTASDDSHGFGAEATVSVGEGAVTHFGVAGPTTTVSGQSQSLTVTALNAYGQTVAGYTGTVHLTSTDAAAALPADYAFTSDDAGVHAFTVGLVTAGAKSVTVKDTAKGSVAGTAALTVTPGATSGLLVTAPDHATTGQALSIKVSAVDAAGNVTPGYQGTVTLTSSDTSAALPAAYTFTAKDKGVHAFAVTLRTAGDQTVTATDSSFTAARSVTVDEGAVTHLSVVAGSSAGAGAGELQEITISALNAYNKVVAGYRGTVHVSLPAADTAATLPSDYTFTADDAGVHSLGVAGTKAGAEVVTVKDAAKPAIAGSATLTVVAGAVASIGVTVPASLTAGQAGSITVRLLDAFGNVSQARNVDAISFRNVDTKDDMLGTDKLPPNYTFTVQDRGSHTFTVDASPTTDMTFSLGDTSVSVGPTGFTAIARATFTVHVVPGAAASLALVVGGPASIRASARCGIGFIVRNAYGASIAYNGTVRLTSTDPKTKLYTSSAYGASAVGLPYTYTFGSDSGSGAQPYVEFHTAGTQTLTLTDTAKPALHASLTFTVAPGPASAITVVPSSTSPIGGKPMTVTVTVRDADGNPVTDYTGTVTLTTTDDTAVLPAPYTYTAKDKGAHVFGVTMRAFGTHTITATPSGSGLPAAAVDVFTG